MPSTLKKIDGYAFSRTRLKTIGFPSGLKRLGEGAFSYCAKLKKTEGFEKTKISYLPEVVFFDTRLKGLTIPKSCKTIEDNAFWSTKIKEVQLTRRKATKLKFQDSRSKVCSMKPTTTSVKSVKTIQGVGGGLQVSWKKPPKASKTIDGYELWLSTSKSFVKSKTIKTTFNVGNKPAKKGMYRGGGLKKGSRYYAKIRTYKKLKLSDTKITYYTAWSKVKSGITG